MKVVCKDIEMIAYFKKDGDIEPIRFRLSEDEAFKVVKIEKVLDKTVEKLCGNKMMVFRCSANINNTQKIMELKYDISRCSWMLFKL